MSIIKQFNIFRVSKDKSKLSKRKEKESVDLFHVSAEIFDTLRVGTTCC